MGFNPSENSTLKLKTGDFLGGFLRILFKKKSQSMANLDDFELLLAGKKWPPPIGAGASQKQKQMKPRAAAESTCSRGAMVSKHSMSIAPI